MKEKLLFILYVLFIIMFLYMNSFSVKATSAFQEIIGGAENFISDAENIDEAGDPDNKIPEQKGRRVDGNYSEFTNKISDISDTIYNILIIIAIVVAVIIAGVLGIKFMFGSLEDQAKVKESLVPFIVGCVVAFGAFGIWKIVVEIGNKF